MKPAENSSLKPYLTFQMPSLETKRLKKSVQDNQILFLIWEIWMYCWGNSSTAENEKQLSDSEIEVDLSQGDCTGILILSEEIMACC